MCVTRIYGWGAYKHTYILLLLFIFPLTSLMRFAVAETLFPSITLRSLAAAAVIVVTATAAVSTVNEQSNPSRTGCWHTHWLSSIYKSMCEKECECVWVFVWESKCGLLRDTVSLFVAIQNGWKRLETTKLLCCYKETLTMLPTDVHDNIIYVLLSRQHISWTTWNLNFFFFFDSK